MRRTAAIEYRIVRPDGNLITEASIFDEAMLCGDLELAAARAENALRSLQGPLADWWRAGLRQVRVIE